MSPNNSLLLQKLKSRIEQIEKLSYEMKEIGEGIPVVEKNVQSLLSAVYILKYEISDVAEIDAI